MKVPELLDLLERIEQAAVDGDVVQALLLCQKLGGDADSAALRDWARHELEGYPDGVSEPHRIIAVSRRRSWAMAQRRASAFPLFLSRGARSLKR